MNISKPSKTKAAPRPSTGGKKRARKDGRNIFRNEIDKLTTKVQEIEQRFLQWLLRRARDRESRGYTRKEADSRRPLRPNRIRNADLRAAFSLRRLGGRAV